MRNISEDFLDRPAFQVGDDPGAVRPWPARRSRPARRENVSGRGDRPSFVPAVIRFIHHRASSSSRSVQSSSAPSSSSAPRSSMTNSSPSPAPPHQSPRPHPVVVGHEFLRRLGAIVRLPHGRLVLAIALVVGIVVIILSAAAGLRDEQRVQLSGGCHRSLVSRYGFRGADDTPKAWRFCRRRCLNGEG